LLKKTFNQKLTLSLMKKRYASLLYLILLSGFIYFIFYFSMPQNYSKGSVPLSEFSTERALKHVKIISKKPHYVGSENHKEVLNYLDLELKKLGLETQIQEDLILSKWNNLVHTKNLITRIKGSGNGKALLLLSHYDSAPHSKSHGASDDANGLAAILEGVRAFLQKETPHENDIIIVFSDGEELGLNGAFSFASKHPWANNVGLVINFEARGSNGPSIMLAETNGGNSNLIREFALANPKYEVSNSLMYSIYKMLPNDTDLTAFRETKNIPGFNFAYIEDHFDYHTAQDNYENFTPECLEHQATYLMPLLNHFSNIDLTKLQSKEERVYFNLPFSFIHYPYSYNLPLLIGAFGLFILFTFFGLAKRTLSGNEIFKGFLPLLSAIIFSGAVTFGGWKILLIIYPEYQDMLHGFTYNGTSYFFAFMMLTLAICFWFYGKWINTKHTPSHFIAPIFIWLILSTLVFVYLEGASFLIIPIYFALFTLGFTIFNKTPNPLLYLFLGFPAIAILVPFIQLLPVALGLKIMFGSAILVVLTFSLLIPLFGNFANKRNWGFLFLLISMALFTKAHLDSGFVKGKAKPNSLLYVYDANKKSAVWATYDKVLDPWTKHYLGKNAKPAQTLNQNTFASKHNSGFSYTNIAPNKNIAEPTFNFLKDTVVGNYRKISVLINPNRKVNRIDVFANKDLKLYNLTANGVERINQKGSFFKRKNNQVLNYYPINDTALLLSFQIKKDDIIDMDVMTSSFDLLENSLFTIPSRPSNYIPMPFVLNDAIVVKKKITKEKTIKNTDYLNQ